MIARSDCSRFFKLINLRSTDSLFRVLSYKKYKKVIIISIKIYIVNIKIIIKICLKPKPRSIYLVA